MIRRYAIGKNISVLLTASLAASFAFAADDSANKKLENKVDRIYHEYHANSTDESIWDYVQQSSGKRNYKTKKGDTLWDISSVLFGDPGFWPKVWSLNKDVIDPHAVPPGTILNFSTGNMDEAPSVSIFGVPEWSPPPEARLDVISHTINAEIPLPQYESRAPMDEFPSSLPGWQFAAPTEVKVESKIDISARQIKAASPLKYLESYLSEKDFDSEGEVIGTELDMTTAAEFQYLFVKLRGTQSKKYIVVKDAGRIKKDTFFGKSGHVIEVLGEIEVSESVNPDKNTYRALVKKNIGQISKGAKLISGSLPTFQFDDHGPIGTVDARIIGGRFNLNRRLFGTDSIVYLNLGADGGVSNGMILPIYQYQLGPRNSDIVKVNPIPIGKMKVIHITPEFSTAIVLECNREVQVGDGTSRMASEAKFDENGALIEKGNHGEPVDALKEEDRNFEPAPQNQESTPADEQPSSSQATTPEAPVEPLPELPPVEAPSTPAAPVAPTDSQPSEF